MWEDADFGKRAPATSCYLSVPAMKIGHTWLKILPAASLCGLAGQPYLPHDLAPRYPEVPGAVFNFFEKTPQAIEARSVVIASAPPNLNKERKGKKLYWRLAVVTKQIWLRNDFWRLHA
jgi:hypothetical protein